MNDALTILCGDAIEQLLTLPNESVHCCVTSPPYWGLRDYSTNGQLGLEKTPEEYVAKMVEVFREVRRVLCKDGTLWLNLGDSYNAAREGGWAGGKNGVSRPEIAPQRSGVNAPGLKPKDLCGIPWRVAFALQADGWYLRSDIIWAKPNPMPESVTDRPTKSHEYLFLLTKSANYFYDAEAIKEPISESYATDKREHGVIRQRFYPNSKYVKEGMMELQNGEFPGERRETNRNKRSVWTVATAPYPEAHFATYPPDLIKPCILAGTSAKGCCAKCGSPWERITERVATGRTQKMADGWDTGSGAHGTIHRSGREAGETGVPVTESKTIGWQPTCDCSSTDLLGNKFCKPIKPCTILDPFAGSGTTGAVALELGRKAILIELNPKYIELIQQRCDVTLGLALA